MDDPLCKSSYVVLILFQSFGWTKTFLIRKILIATIIPLIHHSFADWFSFFLSATVKLQEQQALHTIIHFHLFFQTLLYILTITSSRYSVYQLPGKEENSSFLTQIWPKKDLGLETEKSNVEIRINIVETLCVPIFRQTGQLWVFLVCANFQLKQTTLTFLAQICPKRKLGFEIHEN